MEFIHLFCKLFLKAILHAYWIFPVRKRRITLLNELSFSYGDSMKYLHKYIKTNEINLEVIFPNRDTSNEKDNGLIKVKPMSVLYFYYLLTSSAIVTNAGGVSYLPLRRKQLVVNTWHGGGPYKKINMDVFDNKWYRKESKMNASNTDYILSSCELFSKYEVPALMMDKSKCIECGLPRNDVFFHNDEMIKKRVYDYYNLPKNYKTILYAPTFRSNLNDFTSSMKYNEIDLNVDRVIEAFKEKFGGEWVFAIRMHPKIRKEITLDMNTIDMSEYPDMQELLYTADAVITDFSSLMWDFSFTYRPCLLYSNDIETYERERGFYMPISQWPYPIAHSEEELISIVRDFDLNDYIDKVNTHHIQAGSFENGKASDTVLKLIISHIEGEFS